MSPRNQRWLILKRAEYQRCLTGGYPVRYVQNWDITKFLAIIDEQQAEIEALKKVLASKAKIRRFFHKVAA